MDKHGNILEVLENWKVVGAIAAVCIIVVLFSVLIGSLQKKGPTNDTKSLITTEVNTAAVPTSSAPIKPSSSGTTPDQMLSDDKFTLDYPNTWDAVVNPLAGGGEILTLTPPENNGSIGKLIVQVVQQGTVDVTSMTKLFENGQLSSQTQMRDGVSVVVYQGNVQTLTTTIFEKALIASFDGNVYMVKYLAPNANLQSELENVFTTFHFKSS